MNRALGLILVLLLSSCSNYGQLTFVTKLPKKLKENSGIVILKDSSLWFVEDGGNPDILYNVDYGGNIGKKFKVKNAKNKDWEDLSKDSYGNVYIGDIGNNNSTRKELTIYKVPSPIIEKGDKIDAEKIDFIYPEQKDYTPKKDGLLYDSEAFFHHKGFLYVITKNRTRPFNGRTFIYKVPAVEGNYKATLVGEFVPCLEQHICEITSADISPDGKTIVLLGYGTLWVYTEFTMDNFTKGNLRTIDLGATTQLEAVCFKDNTTLLISDEQRGATGRNLYTYSLDRN